MIKNFIKTGITTSLLMSSTLTLADNNSFYIKGGLGLNHINSTTFASRDFEGKINLKNSFPVVESAIGYNITDSIKVELAFDYYFLFHTQEKSTNANNDIFLIQGKNKVDTLMINMYKDIATFGNVTPFFGGGIGTAFINIKNNGYGIPTDEPETKIALESLKSKHQKFVCKLTTGLDFKVSDSSNVEISYNYFNFGKHIAKLSSNASSKGGNGYGVHNIMLGWRVKL